MDITPPCARKATMYNMVTKDSNLDGKNIKDTAEIDDESDGHLSLDEGSEGFTACESPHRH